MVSLLEDSSAPFGSMAFRALVEEAVGPFVDTHVIFSHALLVVGGSRAPMMSAVSVAFRTKPFRFLAIAERSAALARSVRSRARTTRHLIGALRTPYILAQGA